MAKLVFTNGYVSLNGVNLSDHVSQIGLDLTFADVDVTAMGAGGKQRLSGLQDNKVTLTMWQDFAAAEVDATLQGWAQGGSILAATILASGTAASSTNPYYSGQCVITDYQPISGKVGDGLSASVTLVVSGTITRGTTGP